MRPLKKLFLVPFAAVVASTLAGIADETTIRLGGNAYVTSDFAGAEIRDEGVVNWKDSLTVVSAYFSVAEPQKDVKVSVRARGHSKINVTVAGKTVEVSLNSDDFSVVPVGTFSFEKAGYQRVDFSGVSKTGNTFGEVSDIILDGVKCPVNYVHDFENYWGRRGPSVHMGYQLPEGKDIEYFYNEVYVPVGEDTMHTYFMACGFGQGYFGMQVNSPTERRVLFSVWSPFETHNPKEIPEEMRVKKLRQGADVHIGEFGNEGAGGQSYLRYQWSAGNTYRFLAKVHPDGTGNTVYTAYFFAPEENKWRLIASFSRPKTDTWYTGAHSFLENFNPNAGWRERSVRFGNQWARDKDGNWYELTNGRFTCDATGGKRVRIDYTGGVTETRNAFFLKNCGFINENTPSGTPLVRLPSGRPAPVIDFDALEKL